MLGRAVSVSNQASSAVAVGGVVSRRPEPIRYRVIKKKPFFFTKSAMPRSEAQPDSSRAGTKRPQDNLSKDTPPGSKPRGHKKPAPQRDQIEGEPQRLAFHAENQQSVLLLPEAPVDDKQPEPQPASEEDAHSPLRDRVPTMGLGMRPRPNPMRKQLVTRPAKYHHSTGCNLIALLSTGTKSHWKCGQIMSIIAC